MRLIDADALEEELKKDIMGGLNYRWYINNAPTVDVLDKIRDEIEQTADEEQKHDKKWAMGLRYAVKIIDKYR